MQHIPQEATSLGNGSLLSEISVAECFLEKKKKDVKEEQHKKTGLGLYPMLDLYWIKK